MMTFEQWWEQNETKYCADAFHMSQSHMASTVWAAAVGAERRRKVMQTAQAHGGQYLLPRRYGRQSLDGETNLDYAICEELVAAGYARWISDFDSNMAPGIRLTGKGGVVPATSPPPEDDRKNVAIPMNAQWRSENGSGSGG